MKKDDRWYAGGMYLPSTFEYDMRRFFALHADIMECIHHIREKLALEPTDYDCCMSVIPLFTGISREPSEVSVTLTSDLLNQPHRVKWCGYTLGVALDIAEPEIREWMQEALDELEQEENVD